MDYRALGLGQAFREALAAGTFREDEALTGQNRLLERLGVSCIESLGTLAAPERAPHSVGLLLYPLSG